MKESKVKAILGCRLVLVIPDCFDCDQSASDCLLTVVALRAMAFALRFAALLFLFFDCVIL